MTTTFTSFDTPIGTMRPYVRANETGEALVAIQWQDESTHAYLRDAVEVASAGRSPLLADICEQLMEYFRGQRTHFSIRMEPKGTEFQRDAWKALAEIPYGETSTYSRQAARIGRPTAVRAIGAANGRNPIPIIVPCHRVIGADGSLTGFAGGLDAKRWLLNLERRASGNDQAAGQISLL
jgi:methylated-DNA-[protein]-cysteine S-methyltransferase